jgi:hypothetical protein
MSELIAIPLESDRRAVAVLAALRRLQAEYEGEGEGDAAGSGVTGDDRASLLGPDPGRRRVWRRLRSILLAALALGATGAAVALLSGALPPDAGHVEGAIPPQLRAGAVALLVAAACALLLRLPRRGGRPRKPRRGARPTVTWLVSYVMRDASSTGRSRLRATILQVTLPVEAEGRLRAILARADATAVR